MYVLQLLIAVFFTSLFAIAAPDICSDLYSGSCEAGVIEDGTGSTVLAPPAASTPDLEAQKQLVDTFFNAHLQDLRKQAGLYLKLECNNGSKADLADSSSCNNEIRAKITELLNRRLQTGSNGRYTGAELQFMEEFGFLKLLNEVRFGREAPAVNIRAQEEKVAQLFPQVKEALITKIRKSPLSPEKKAAVIKQLNRVNFAGTDCGAEFGEVSGEFLPKAFYDPGNGKFFLCRNLLNQANSEFALITIIAHEISHSIDTCSLRLRNPQVFGHHQVNDLQTGDDESPFAGLINCLRSPLSVRARTKPIEVLAREKFPANRPTFDYCEGSDQICEASSDWFASEVITDIVAKNHPNLTQKQWRDGFRNTFRAKCDQQHETREFEEHPSLRDRYNSNILANAAIRKKMGCGATHTKLQCSFEGKIYSESESSADTNPGRENSNTDSRPQSGGKVIK